MWQHFKSVPKPTRKQTPLEKITRKLESRSTYLKTNFDYILFDEEEWYFAVDAHINQTKLSPKFILTSGQVNDFKCLWGYYFIYRETIKHDLYSEWNDSLTINDNQVFIDAVIYTYEHYCNDSESALIKKYFEFSDYEKLVMNWLCDRWGRREDFANYLPERYQYLTTIFNLFVALSERRSARSRYLTEIMCHWPESEFIKVIKSGELIIGTNITDLINNEYATRDAWKITLYSYFYERGQYNPNAFLMDDISKLKQSVTSYHAREYLYDYCTKILKKADYPRTTMELISTHLSLLYYDNYDWLLECDYDDSKLNVLGHIIDILTEKKAGYENLMEDWLENKRSIIKKRYKCMVLQLVHEILPMDPSGIVCNYFI